MKTAAFAAGPAVLSKAALSTTSTVDTIRSASNAKSVVLRRSSFVSTRKPCGCAGACYHRRDVAVAPVVTNTKMSVALSPGETLIADMMTENAAFVRGEAKVFPGVPEERARLSSEGQAPGIAIIACADSRVAPEILFRANVGELFVMRCAGNTPWGEEVLGSLEFAINVLGVKAVMVLGHTKCGAVAAAVGGGSLPGALGAHIVNISEGLKAKGGMLSDVDLAVEVNVKAALDFLRKDPEGAVAQGEKNGLAVRGAVYDISTGAVRLV